MATESAQGNGPQKAARGRLGTASYAPTRCFGRGWGPGRGDPSRSANPRILLRKGDLVGEVALNHAQTANAAITSVDENGVPVETTAFAINCETFKRIVRTRIHRQRQL